MSRTISIWIARHGESCGAEENRYGGVADFPLSLQGRHQAAELSNRVLSIGLNMILTSPLKRARQTAEIVWPPEQGNQIVIMEDLQEWNSYGVLTGLRPHEATELFPEIMLAVNGRPQDVGECILGNEPIRLFRERVMRAWKTCLRLIAEEPALRCLMIVHGKFLQELVAMLSVCGQPSYEPCSLNLLQYRPMSCRTATVLGRRNHTNTHKEKGSTTVKIYLVRHGESQDDIDCAYGGAADHQLTPRGEEQAFLIASQLKGNGIRRIYTSPFRRAARTASIIADVLGLQPETHVVSDLRERNSYGVLSGVRKTEAPELFPLFLKPGEVRSGYDKTPLLGAEEFEDFLKRVSSGFAEVVTDATKNGLAEVALVSHGTFLKALVTEHLGLSLPADWTHGSALLLEYVPAAATISNV